MKTVVLMVLGLMVVGCSVGPDYRRPEIEEPAEWQYQDTSMVLDSAAIAAADTGWWEMFGDTVLTNLIHSALRENHDVRIAAARVEQYLGLYGVAKSDFFPKLDAQGAARRGQSLLSGDGTFERPTANIFALELSASWEIDIWGKVRRATEAARADLLAAEESRRAVALSVVGFTAEAYIDLLSLDKQLDVARRTVASREMSLDLFRQRLDKGDISDLELSQIESQYWLAKAQIPVLEKTIAQLEHALSVLLGRNPGRIPRGLPLDSLRLPGIPEGIPSEILEGRPDVRLAEEQLRAANARIGVAKSLYFPSISLTGLFGVASGDLSNLFTANAQTWAIGGGILAPIFHWGEISGQVDAAEAFQKQTLHVYVQAVQSAFRDAEDALVGRSRTQEQEEAQANQVRSLRQYERLARMRYRDGVTSYLEVLDAERSLFSTELEYAQTQGNLLKSVVGVYKAFAGGWADWVAMEAYQPDDPVDRRDAGQEEQRQEQKAP
jgi:multidrug efflux system outer membrane protein